MRERRILIILMGLACALDAVGQTKLPLAAIKPGTERVQLIPNGDFQQEGIPSGSAYPFPLGWSRSGNMFVGSGSNTVEMDSGVVAFANYAAGVSSSVYQQNLTLDPATSYVFSAYLWNMGDGANHVNTVIDFSDAPGEPQVVLTSADAGAAQGYFVYNSFSTSVTGTNITVRAFYDGPVGNGAAAAYWPLAAQWDNLAITKAANFSPPQPNNSSATIRPLVTITSPLNNSALYVPNPSQGITISATATDLDGTVTSVEFFAGANSIGKSFAAPWMANWTNLHSGSYVLTAIATDNSNATTISSPVSVSLAALPPVPQLSIALSSNIVTLFWPTDNTAVVVQTVSNLAAAGSWNNLTNSSIILNGSNSISLPAAGAASFYRLGSEVDPSAMFHKLLMGYQGWFSCPGDGSAPNQWLHWFRNNTPVATNALTDVWPDVSEFGSNELFTAAMTLSNGSPARLFSAYTPTTVMRHFKWMKDNHLDGVFLQRFSSELSNAGLFAQRNQVALNVRAGADAYGRAFAIMYDISGQPTNTTLSTLTNDWAYLVNNLQITASPFYLRHHNKPVVAVWGFGFNDGNHLASPQQAQQIINFFKSAGCTVVGGVPTYWRTLSNDSYSDPAWTAVYYSFDVISPWAVGRFGDIAGADNFRQNLITPDLAAATSAHCEYMPVIFPGFSWHNLNGGPLNQIPRMGGIFYWEQAYNCVASGCTMVYGAMFDEVNEGTAMFKLAATPAQLPASGSFLPLDIDGYTLPSDWYLQLADQAGRMLRGEIALQKTLPISPN